MKEFTEKDVRSWVGSESGRTLFGLSADQKDLVDAPLWWHRRGLQETASGYGARLTMSRKICFCGRLYRLYCTIFSNNGSVWFKTKGRQIFVN